MAGLSGTTRTAFPARSVTPPPRPAFPPGLPAWPTPPPPERPPGDVGRRSRRVTTPMVLRAVPIGLIGLLVALTAVLLAGIGSARDGLRVVGHDAGPRVVSANELHGALAAMDAELADIVLVGDEIGLGFDRDQASANLAADRQAVANALQKSSVGARSSSARAAVAELIDQLGVYDNLAGQVVLMDRQADPRVLATASPALELLRRATDLLHQRLLPAADRLVAENVAAVDGAYVRSRADTRAETYAVLGIGAVVIAGLVAAQVFTARRTRRMVNPGLAAATVLAVVLVAWAGSVLFGAAEQLRVAKRDAYDSVLALARTKAVVTDANGDESRYLVDPGRAEIYQAAFFAKSQELAGVPGARIDTYDAALADLAKHPADLKGPLFGREFNNITFAGEGAAAAEAFRWYRTYQLYDRELRALSRTDPRRAIELDTSRRENGSDWAFERLQLALDDVLRINRTHMDRATAAGESRLAGWGAIAPIGAVAIAATAGLGVRGRLREYR